MHQQQYDAAYVESLLLAAGRTLSALPRTGCWPSGFRSGMPEVVRTLDDLVGAEPDRLRVAAPTPRAIAAMEQALSWIKLIPADRIVMRRIVGARMLCRPHQDKPMVSWRKVAAMVGASHEAVRGWHAEAISMIVGALNRPGFCQATGGLVGPGPDQVELQVRRAMVRARRQGLAAQVPELA